MTVEVMNPDGLPKPDMYRQVAVATGTKLVFIAGQVARNEHGDAAAVKDIDPLKPITLVGVATLGEPDLLIEVEAMAVLA